MSTIIRESDLSAYAIELGVWESLCELAEVDQCEEEIIITAAKGTE